MMSCHAQEEQPVAYNELDATKTPATKRDVAWELRVSIARTVSFSVAGVVAVFGFGMLYFDYSRRRKYVDWYRLGQMV